MVKVCSIVEWCLIQMASEYQASLQMSSVVYFDQLLGAGQTTFFSRFQPLCSFSTFLSLSCSQMSLQSTVEKQAKITPDSTVETTAIQIPTVGSRHLYRRD